MNEPHCLWYCHCAKLNWRHSWKLFLSNIFCRANILKISMNINTTLLNLINFYLFFACYCPFFEYFTGTPCKRNQSQIFSPIPVRHQLMFLIFITVWEFPKFLIRKFKDQVSKVVWHMLFFWNTCLFKFLSHVISLVRSSKKRIM